MAKVKTRGTLIKATISAVLTTIAQVDEIDTGETKSRTLDVECMDDSGVGVEMMNDGCVTQGEVTFAGLFDPDGATQQFLTDTILAPSGFPVACSIVFADSTPASATFSAVGFGFQATASVKGALRFRGSMTPATYLTWPT